MISNRLDFWGLLQKYVRQAEKEYCTVNTETDLVAFEAKWLDPERGVIHRLEHKPVLAGAQPTARKVFLEYLKNRIYGLVHLWRETEEFFH